jgi:hypothetical protein
MGNGRAVHARNLQHVHTGQKKRRNEAALYRHTVPDGDRVRINSI